MKKENKGKFNIQVGDLWDSFFISKDGKKCPIEEQCYRIQIIAKATFRHEVVFIGRAIMYWVNGNKTVLKPFETPSFCFIGSDGIEKSDTGRHITLFRKVSAQKGTTYPLVDTDVLGVGKLIDGIIKIGNTTSDNSRYRKRVLVLLDEWLGDLRKPC